MRYLCLVGLLALVTLAGCEKQPQQTGMDEAQVRTAAATEPATTAAEVKWLTSLDEGEQPCWSSDLKQRGPVFSFPANCRRSDAVYVPGLKRYLLALGFDQQGGWGLFDAPEPWGPWTTVFATHDWGLGETHGYRLPTKWISADGTALQLVFSGRTHEGTEYDAFCVRRMDLRLYPPAQEIGAP